ncbi:MAG: hypothetical protein ACREPE_01995 [Lysobacter sp.]
MLLAALAACSKPKPPEKDRPPEPQAAQHTELRDAIQAPIDKAKAAEAEVKKAADDQRAVIEAQLEG